MVYRHVRFLNVGIRDCRRSAETNTPASLHIESDRALIAREAHSGRRLFADAETAKPGRWGAAPRPLGAHEHRKEITSPRPG